MCCRPTKAATSISWSVAAARPCRGTRTEHPAHRKIAMLLIQFKTPDARTCVGVLDAETRQVRPIAGFQSTHALAQAAIARQVPLEALLATLQFDAPRSYDAIASEGLL